MGKGVVVKFILAASRLLCQVNNAASTTTAPIAPTIPKTYVVLETVTVGLEKRERRVWTCNEID
jgi:hypothetical protein